MRQKQARPGEPLDLGTAYKRVFFWPLFWAFFINFTAQICFLAANVVLKLILDNWLAGKIHDERNYTFSAIATALLLAFAVGTVYAGFIAKKTGIQLTKAVNGVLLNKVFTLSHRSLSDCSQGKLLAMIAQDSEFVTEQFSQVLDQ